MNELGRGPQRRANIIETFDVTDENVILGFRPTRRLFESAYVLFTLEDSIEPPQDNVALPEGHMPRGVILQRPADVFTFRLVTRQRIRNRDVVNVQPGSFDGTTAWVAPEGWQIPLK